MKRRAARALALWGGLVGVMTGTVVAGARVNSTASFPVGLYWAINVPPNKGDLVLFCPPRGEVFDEAKRRGYLGAGYCPGGYGYLLKKIVAVHNDIVTITDEGVFVNSERIQNSQPLPADLAGQSLPHYRTLDQRMKQNDVVLLSDYSQKSFDARYFGPLNKKQIRNVVRPVLTW